MLQSQINVILEKKKALEEQQKTIRHFFMKLLMYEAELCSKVKPTGLDHLH